VRLIRTDSLGNPEWCCHSLGSGLFFFPPPNAFYDRRGTQDCVRSAVEPAFSLQDKKYAGLNTPNDRNELIKSNADEHPGRDLAQARLAHKFVDLKSKKAARGPGNNRPGDGNVSASLVKGIDTQDDHVLAWELTNFHFAGLPRYYRLERFCLSQHGKGSVRSAQDHDEMARSERRRLTAASLSCLHHHSGRPVRRDWAPVLGCQI
jgi:hypothetical protein